MNNELEEAADKYCLINNIPTDQIIVKNDRSCEFENPVTIFIQGAKWQQERSDIEANKIIEFLDNEAKLKISDTKTIERIKWYFETYFEQFKKK